MTVLYVQEYAGLANTSRSDVAVPAEPPLVSQKVDYTSAHAESAAFSAATTIIAIQNDSLCAVLVSKAGTAAQLGVDKRLPAGSYLVMGVSPGQKISAVTTT